MNDYLSRNIRDIDGTTSISEVAREAMKFSEIQEESAPRKPVPMEPIYRSGLWWVGGQSFERRYQAIESQLDPNDPDRDILLVGDHVRVVAQWADARGETGVVYSKIDLHAGVVRLPNDIAFQFFAPGQVERVRPSDQAI